MNPVWLVTGKGRKYLSEKEIAGEPEIIEVKYEGAEKRSGKDRRNGLAYESCGRLLEIERLNQAVFLLTVGDVKSRLWALENLESPDDTLCNKPKNVEDKPA